MGKFFSKNAKSDKAWKILVFTLEFDKRCYSFGVPC